MRIDAEYVGVPLEEQQAPVVVVFTNARKRPVRGQRQKNAGK